MITTTTSPFPIFNVSFSGGGTRTAGYAGVYRALKEYGILDTVRGVVGSSAGTIACACVALRYTVKECEDLLMSLDKNVLMDWMPFGKLQYAWRYSRYLSVNTGENLSAFLKKLVQKKASGDLSLNKIVKCPEFLNDIRIVGTNRNWQRQEFLNETHPNEPYWKLMRASCSLPIWFKPVTLGNDQYIDGGLMNNDALTAFDEKDEYGRVTKPNMHTLNFLLFHPGEMRNSQLEQRRDNPTSVEEDISYTFDCATTQNLRMHIQNTPRFWERTISLPVGNIGMLDALTTQQKQKLVNDCYEATKEGLEKRGFKKVY